MTSSRLVSVIMPFFDTPPRFMREAIESVLAQTHGDWELLMVDDGSGPESAETARRYAADNPRRIRCLEHPDHANKGAGISRQLAVAQARGAYFGLLDADDLWLPEKLEEQLDILARDPTIGVLYGNTRYWYSWAGAEAGARADYVPDLRLRANVTYEGSELLRRFVRGRVAVPCTCSIVLTREAMENSGGFELGHSSIYDDQIFYMKLCLRNRVHVSDKTWDWYRQHPESDSHVAERDGDLAALRLEFLRWFSNYLGENGVKSPELWSDVKREIWMYSQPRWLPRIAHGRVRWAKKWLLRTESFLTRESPSA